MLIDYLRMLRISDWIRFYPIIPVAAALLAGATLTQLLLVFLIYFALFGYAFAINNYCDVEIDRLHRIKLDKNKNPMCSGNVSPRRVQILMLLLIGLSLLSLFMSGYGFVLVLINLGLVTAYSGGLRLKEWPVLDIITHGLMFGALPFLAGFALVQGEIGPQIFALSAIPFLLGCEALIAHQIIDYQIDVTATRTTVTSIGPRKGLALLAASAVASVIMLLGLAPSLEIPVWAAALIGVYLLTYPAYSCRGIFQ